MRRALTIASGVGALAALIVMLVAIVTGVGGDDASPAVQEFPSGSLAVGLQDDEITAASADQVERRLDRLASSGVTVTRVGVRWLEIAPFRPARPADPTDPVYEWGRLDAVLDGLAKRHIRTIVDVSGTPPWANGGRGPEWAPSADDYGAFIRALATRYDGTAHAALRFLEPWNEPNNPLVLMPQWEVAGGEATAASPGRYGALLARARTELASAAPDAQVIGLAAAPIPVSAPPTGGVGVLDFVNGLAAGGAPMDAVSVHLTAAGAGTDPAQALGPLPALTRELDHLAPGAPVLVTEVGLPTPAEGPSEAVQAAAIPVALRRLAADPAIRLAVWRSAQDGVDSRFGLVRANGSEKPGWAVFVDSPKSLPSGSAP